MSSWEESSALKAEDKLMKVQSFNFFKTFNRKGHNV